MSGPSDTDVPTIIQNMEKMVLRIREGKVRLDKSDVFLGG